MNIFIWQPPPNSTDSDNLCKAVDAMRAAADLLSPSRNNCENIEISLFVGNAMFDLLNSTAEVTNDIANRLYKEQGGNVQKSTLHEASKQ